MITWLIPTEDVTVRSMQRYVKTKATAVSLDDDGNKLVRILVGPTSNRHQVDIPLHRVLPVHQSQFVDHFNYLESEYA